MSRRAIQYSNDKVVTDTIERLSTENTDLKKALQQKENEVKRLKALSQRISESAALAMKYEDGLEIFHKLAYCF